MRRISLFVTIGSFALLAACTSTALVPGAEKVRITSNASDVTNCKAVGNLTLPNTNSANVNLENVLRDQTIGFGGNTAFVTPGAGVAYQCP